MDNTRLLLLALLAYAGSLAPIVVSAGLVLFKGRGVPGRWIFLLAGPVLAYTVVWVLTLVFFAPAWIVITFLAPAVKDFTDSVPYWVPIARWLSQNDWWIAALGCAGLASWLALYVWPRWPALFHVMVAPPSVPKESAQHG